MTEPLAPLDDELEAWLAPARAVPQLSVERQAAALAGVQNALMASPPAPALDASTGAAGALNPWWMGGGGMAVGLLIGAGAMWAALGSNQNGPLDTTRDQVTVESEQASPSGVVAPSQNEVVSAVRPAELAGATSVQAESPRAQPIRSAEESAPGSESETETELFAVLTPPANAATDTLQEERRIIDAALAQVSRGHAAAALQSVARHSEQFPSGQLTEAREIVRIRALAALGRIDEATQALSHFRSRFPQSNAGESLGELVER